MPPRTDTRPQPMPKPQRRPAQPDAPQPSQVAAVRRALEDGNAAQARQRLPVHRSLGVGPLRRPELRDNRASVGDLQDPAPADFLKIVAESVLQLADSN